MVGSRLDDLSDCSPTATAFPAGSLYVSAGTTRAVHDGVGALGASLPPAHAPAPPRPCPSLDQSRAAARHIVPEEIKVYGPGCSKVLPQVAG